MINVVQVCTHPTHNTEANNYSCLMQGIHDRKVGVRMPHAVLQ